jgi:ornithine cyclodeaminase/alanine dehydrogenase-like protein (mu-crystallin family)
VLLRLGQQDIIAANLESKGGTWSYNPKRTIRAVVFGTGEQAYWHARLLLLARGPVIHTVRFVGRSAAAEAGIVARFERLFREGYAEREGWNGCDVRKFGTGVLGTWKGNEGRDGYLDMVLREADVVFCCTPATEPLFDASAVWRRGAAGEKGRLVVAIGSYKPEMREIPAGWVRRVVDEGLVIVDTVEGALVEAGELIEAGVMKEQLVE